MDNHLHTRFSDGKDSPRDMTLTGIALGYKQITFTDHVRRNSDWLESYISEIHELKKEFKDSIMINCGVEAKIINLNGDIDFDNYYRQQIDFVLASIHRIPVGNEEYINSDNAIFLNKNEIFEYMKKATFNALENPCVDILAHPFQLGAKEQYKKKSSEYCCQLRCSAINHKKHIEFNIGKYNECVQQNYWRFPDFKVWLGSDSHSIDDMIKNSVVLKKIDFKEV